MGVLGNADLFLINPNGIIFGANAQLNVAGSFIGSTASRLQFADGSEFSATSPQNPLLTISTPVGLQFGQTAGRILVQGQGLPLAVSPGSLAPFETEQEAIAIYRDPTAIQTRAIALLGSLLNRPTGLQVPPGKTLALVGGDISLESGHLTAIGGRVALGSVAQPSLVSLTPTDVGWTLGYENVQNFGNVQLLDRASINTIVGDTQIRARNVTLANESSLLAEAFGAQNGKEINIQAAQLNIDGDSVVLTGTVGAGRGGNTTFQVERLNVTDSSGVITGVLGSNQGGKLTIAASDFINVTGNSLLTTSSLGSGVGGDISIETSKLSIQDRGKIISATAGSGNAGNIVLKATDSLEIGKNSFLSASTATSGNAGFIIINTRNLIVADRGQISNASSGSGNSGTLTVEADRVNLSNGSFITVSSLGTGAVGELVISARSIELDNAFITATSNSGNGGDIRLQADDLLLLRRGSSISTRAGIPETNGGTGGTIAIDTANLVALNNSDIDANAFGGTGGQVKIGAQGIFGTEIREQQTPESDITASSDLGADFSGSVEAIVPIVDLRQGLITLPVEVLDASNQIDNSCASSGETVARNKFTITGRGGLPRNPGDTLTDEPVLTSWASLPQTETKSSPVQISSKHQQPPLQIVEAQGWMVNPRGKLFLTAQALNVTPNSNRVSRSFCQKS